MDATTTLANHDSMDVTTPSANQDSMDATTSSANQDSMDATTSLANQDSMDATTSLANQDSMDATTPLANQDSMDATTSLANQDSMDATTPLVNQHSMDATTPLANQDSTDATTFLAYRASQPYSQLRPDAPRYVVPPPNLDYDSGKPVLTLENKPPRKRKFKVFGTAEFLDAVVGEGRHDLIHVGIGWKYQQRRTAQKILPFLLLGPATAAKDTQFVQEQGITLLVAVRSASTARLQAKLLDPSKFASSVGLQTLTLDLESPYDMITKLPSTIKAINDHLEQSCGSSLPQTYNDIPARVLVFCESGNDRSAAVVTAYLMAVYGLGAVEAMQLVQSQRFCMAIDDGSKNMLQTFEDILQAQQDVAVEDNPDVPRSEMGALQPDPTSSGSKKLGKRRFDSANESDEDMEDRPGAKGEGETEGRTGQAPFHDG